MLAPIYDFQDYKVFLNELIQSQKNRGRGLYAKIAKYMGVSNVLVSQVLKGDRHFDRDKVFKVATFFNMDPLRTEYLLCLFERNVAAGDDHQRYLDGRLVKLKEDIVDKNHQIKKSISEEYKKIYYSSWLYGATRLSLLKKSVNTAEDVAQYLNYPLEKIKGILNFLEKAEVVIAQKDGTYQVSDRHVILGKDSKHVMNHHMNLKNLEISKIIGGVQDDEVCYSSMVITSRQAIEDTVKRLRDLIEESNKKFDRGESEDLAIFNLSMINISTRVSEVTNPSDLKAQDMVQHHEQPLVVSP